MTCDVTIVGDPRTGNPDSGLLQRPGQGCAGKVTDDPKFQKNFPIIFNSLNDRTRPGIAFAT
jgi:hypothetical protein